MTRTARYLTAAGAAAVLALVPVTAGAGAAQEHDHGSAKHDKKRDDRHDKKRADKPVRETVRIRDNYYEPARLTVPLGSTIVWKWPATTGDVHDVTLDRGPKGVKKFQSEMAASNFSFKRKLTKKGLYHIVCTLHEEMTMNIRVR